MNSIIKNYKKNNLIQRITDNKNITNIFKIAILESTKKKKEKTKISILSKINYNTMQTIREEDV